MSSIYLHIPFCRRLCGYCDFFKSVKHERMADVISAMKVELRTERNFLSSDSISTIYFGGGTPSLLAPSVVAEFITLIGELYDTSNVSEVTLEANPDDLTPEYLAAIRRAGVNRLSIGVQSFDDQELRFMNRRHNSEQARQAIYDARGAGFDNIAIDLIFGVAGFDEECLNRSLDEAIRLGVEHIAAYHLTIEPGTLFARRVERGEFSAVSEDVSEQEFEIVRRRLCEAGYEHYEISNYAKPKCRSQHNSSYWRGAEYLGIGAGAHSFAHGVRRWSEGSIEQYLGEMEGCERYDSERLTTTQERNEMVMTALRCCEGIDLTLFRERFGEVELQSLINDAKRSLEIGELVLEDEPIINRYRLRIPTKHFLLSDMIISELFSNNT